MASNTFRNFNQLGRRCYAVISLPPRYREKSLTCECILAVRRLSSNYAMSAVQADLPPRPQRRKRRRAGASGGRKPATAPPSSGPPTAPVFGSSGMVVPSNIGGHRAVEPVAETNVPRFSAASSALFGRIDAALLHLRPPVNEFLEVELDGGSVLRIKLGPELGTYEIRADEDRCVLEMTSPTGSFTYVLERSTGDFVEEADGHSLVGLLTRDLIRQIQGYPNF